MRRPPDRDNGYVYGNGKARPLEPVTANHDVTAGFQATPAYGMFLGSVLHPAPLAQPARPRWYDDAQRMFTVIGMVAAIAILLGAGLYLVVQTACPCTFGGAPVVGEPTPTITVNASQYDPAGTCITGEVP